MDTMTLLCNLQAEGPTTLRRLREYGCGTFAELRRAPIARLAEALGTDESSAQRFLREAEVLSLRMGEDDFGSRELEGPGASQAAPGAPVVTRLESGEVREGRLQVGMIAGLDSLLCGALDSYGIRSLEELWSASALELSRHLGCSFTALVDLQSEARQAILARGEKPAAEPTAPETPGWNYSIIPAESAHSGSAPQGMDGRPLPCEEDTRDRMTQEAQPGAGGPFS